MTVLFADLPRFSTRVPQIRDFFIQPRADAIAIRNEELNIAVVRERLAHLLNSQFRRRTFSHVAGHICLDPISSAKCLKDVKRAVTTTKKSQAVMSPAWLRRNADRRWSFWNHAGAAVV